MKSELQQTGLGVVEITNDGTTVWVNTELSNIGRFGRYGIDVHRTLDAQLQGASQCLACTHGPTHLAEWRRFQLLMLEHYGIEIIDWHMPQRIMQELTDAV